MTAVDCNTGMLNVAKGFSTYLSASPKYLEADILSMRDSGINSDTIFSHGVLEHFSDENATRILRDQLSMANKVVFSVPSNFFNDSEKINGDERFMAAKKWRDLIQKAGGSITNEFGFFYRADDLVSSIKAYVRSLARGVKPYIGFVLEKKQ